MNWEQIYTEYHPALLEVAARCVGRRTDREASDLVHEVFADVLSDPPADVPDWLVFLADQVTAMGGAECDLPATACLDDGLDAALVEDAAVIAVRRVAAAEVRQRILRVMGYMTERQRQITRLRLFEGLSVGEIAAAMNTSSSNISQIVIRCLTKLQPVLTEFDTFDEHDLERVRPPRRALN